MKTILTLLLAALALVTLAQPQKINYQAIALGSNGKPLKNTAVSLRLSILDSAATGTVLYTETQPATTDAGGQFSVYLGTGTPTAGTFASLPWANGNDKFLKVEMDAQGGTNYQTMGTTQLVSVPYAMASGTANVIEEGTLKKMKNGHIFRLEYDGTPGGYWKLISGFTPAIITQDTFFVCDTSIWIKGKNKRKLFEDPAWSFFGSNGVNGYSQSADSIEIFRRYGDTVFVVYNVFAPGINGNGINADSAYVIFLNLTTSTAGPDQLSLTGTTATLAANTPAAGETGIWTITTGSGATLNNANSPTATFTKGTDSAYTLVWTITGPCGTSRDTVNLLFLAPVGTACGQAVSYAGESYPTVQIGTQCWLAKNLNVGTMIQGANDQTNNSTLEKFCYNNDTANCAIYGGLYQWGEAVQYQNGASDTTSPNPAFTGNVRGICPSGWHLPSDAEYCTLTTFLDATVNCSTIGWSGTDAGGKMKSTSGLWTSPNTGATNSSGFSALPGAYRDTNGTFYDIGSNAGFWSSSESSTTFAFDRVLNYFNSNVNRGYGNKDRGFSARCIMDSCSTTTSSAGPDQLSLSGTTATFAANTPAAGETGIWTITTGSGATLNNANSPTATFTKGTDSAYTLVWTITGPCGTSRDTVNISFQNVVMNVPCPGVASITYAGESYPTVQIGTQCWLAKNLNVGSMINFSDDQTNNQVIEKFCLINDTTSCATYGGLYQWAEAVQYQNGASNANSPSPAFTGSVRGICPTGWHLPSDAEWSSLETTLGGSSVAGVALKSTSGLWHYPNTIATNSSGFSALPGGDRRDKGNGPYNEGLVTFFWSSSESSTADATARALVFDDSSIYRDVGYEKDRGFSVRCLNDSCFTTTTSAGPDQLSLTGTTATLAANTPAAGETGTWTITTGSGATLNNANSPTATFTKGTDSAYTLVWTITGPCGSSRDTVNLLFPAPVGTACGQTVSYAGESYPTVQIGTQCWFAKNLNVGTMIQGANDQTNNSTLEKYCYNNDPANCTTYGGLYQWAEAVQYQNGASNTTSPNPAFSGNVRGICPTGWHLPSDAEYYTQLTFLDSTVNFSYFGWSGTDAGGKMKSVNGLWTSPNVGATNSSGFSALPGGFRNSFLPYFNLRYNFSLYWSSSEASNGSAIFLEVLYNYSNIYRNSNGKKCGLSLRCIQD